MADSSGSRSTGAQVVSMPIVPPGRRPEKFPYSSENPQNAQRPQSMIWYIGANLFGAGVGPASGLVLVDRVPLESASMNLRSLLGVAAASLVVAGITTAAQAQTAQAPGKSWPAPQAPGKSMPAPAPAPAP